MEPWPDISTHAGKIVKPLKQRGYCIYHLLFNIKGTLHFTGRILYLQFRLILADNKRKYKNRIIATEMEFNVRTKQCDWTDYKEIVDMLKELIRGGLISLWLYKENNKL
jgi:hypothetical protein